jgi:hypothetical protein
MPLLKIFFFLSITLLSSNKSISQQIEGVYGRLTQKGVAMRFKYTLFINCDSTATSTFTGDMMNERVEGKWQLKDDTLMIINHPLREGTRDSVNNFGRWKKIEKYITGKNKLTPVIDFGLIYESNVLNNKQKSSIIKQTYRSSILRKEKKIECK